MIGRHCARSHSSTPSNLTFALHPLYPQKLQWIYIMSDSSGATALRTIRALLKQFELGKQKGKVMAPYSKPATFDVRTKNFARVVTLDEAGQVVSHAARKGALVVFTFASEVMRLRVQKMCDSVGISSIDLVGPTIMGLSSFLEMDPIGQVRLVECMDPSRMYPKAPTD